MTNLITTKTTTLSDIKYDWSLIENEDDRSYVLGEIKQYTDINESNVNTFRKLVSKETRAKAALIHSIKQRLPRGQFSDVCEALGVKRDHRSCYVSIHDSVLNGANDEDVLAMADVMEPIAASRLLKSSPEVQQQAVKTYNETGKYPTRSTNSYAELAYQKKQLEQNKEQIAMNAFSDCLENSTVLDTCTDDEGYTQVVSVEPLVACDQAQAVTTVIPTVVTEVTRVDVLSDIQQQLHEFLKGNFRNLTDRQLSTLKVIHNTIENYSLGKIK